MGILEQYMLWKVLKKNEKEKKNCDKLWKSKKSKKIENVKKKMTSSKRLWKEKKENIWKVWKRMVYECMIVDNCGNEMLSSIALKIGSCVENCVTSLFLTPSF